MMPLDCWTCFETIDEAVALSNGRFRRFGDGFFSGDFRWIGFRASLAYDTFDAPGDILQNSFSKGLVLVHMIHGSLGAVRMVVIEVV